VAGDGGQTIFSVFEVFGSEPRTPSLPFLVRVSPIASRFCRQRSEIDNEHDYDNEHDWADL
jgi:hypothetical protein